MSQIGKIVKNNVVYFDFYRAGNLFYKVAVDGLEYSFPVSAEDLGQATVTNEMKAITLMRYIRKAIEDGTYVRKY